MRPVVLPGDQHQRLYTVRVRAWNVGPRNAGGCCPAQYLYKSAECKCDLSSSSDYMSFKVKSAIKSLDRSNAHKVVRRPPFTEHQSCSKTRNSLDRAKQEWSEDQRGTEPCR